MFEPTVIPALGEPHPRRKYFTVDEANRALPFISRVVLDIAEVYSQILELRHELENLDDGDLRNLTEREYEATMDRLGAFVDELHLAGVELRDFERGRVDFPAIYSQREVMLTWATGDPAVTHWHPAEGDDYEPRPVESLLAADADAA
ncbi:MAG: DUF2203 domain-containing protein [Planctomycetota bacterium]